MFVGEQISHEVVVAKYLNVDPDERRQQEQMKQQHQGGAPGGRV